MRGRTLAAGNLWNSSRWQHARGRFLRDNPVCARCMGTSAVVDHVKPHKGDETMFWDRTNWQALCKPCHDKKTAQEDGGGFGGRGTRKRPPEPHPGLV